MTRRHLLKSLGLLPLSYQVGAQGVEDWINVDFTEVERRTLAHAMQNGTQHFKAKEMACRCCNVIKFDVDLLLKLEQLRRLLGNRPIIINSGYRCPKHNKKVGGVKSSQHLLGTAADIQIKGVSPLVLHVAATKLKFNGIGLYKSFIHVDVRSGPVARW